MATAMKCGKRCKIDQEAIVKVKSILSDLPDDAIVEILSGLPVKDVLRFRCVCKSWDSMITDPQFAKCHRYKRTCLFLIDKYHLIKVGDNIDGYGLTPNPPTTMYPSYVPIPGFIPVRRYGNLTPRVLGSCNGLMCLLTTERNMLVWNPCTGKFKNLPKLSVTGLNFFWFGYDKSVDDYKLLLSDYHELVSPGAKFKPKQPVSSTLHVLTLKSNSWRKLTTKDVNFGSSRSVNPNRWYGTLVAGTVHWLVNCYRISNSESFIVAFDLSTENFQSLSKPLDHRTDPCKSTIGVLGGCLCLCSYFYGVHDFELWIMKEYGMISSWTKLAEVSNFILDRSSLGFTPLYFARENEIEVLLDNSRVGEAWIGRLRDVSLQKQLGFSFHDLPKQLVATGLTTSARESGYQSFVHTESLASVDA